MVFPFLLTIALWRMAVAWWNPAGILAMIPVFYCSFVRPVAWFAPMAVLTCFLVDYNFDVPFVWTSIWCLCYALRGFLPFIDIAHISQNAVTAFMIFLGAGVALLALGTFHMMPVFGAIWAYIWTTLLYVPITKLIERIGDD